jgi:hypothetical protein
MFVQVCVEPTDQKHKELWDTLLKRNEIRREGKEEHEEVKWIWEKEREKRRE